MLAAGAGFEQRAEIRGRPLQAGLHDRIALNIHLSNSRGFEMIPAMQVEQSTQSYWQARRERNKQYYGLTTELVKKYAAGANSMIDIGNRGCGYVCEWDWIADRTVLDLSADIYQLDDSVHKIRQDFLLWQPERRYDLVTCLQTLEHIDDPLPFIDKLRQIQGDILIVSLPYLWPASKAPLEHKHDPIDMDKIYRWFGEEPLEHSVATERNGTQRWVGVYPKSRG